MHDSATLLRSEALVRAVEKWSDALIDDEYWQEPEMRVERLLYALYNVGYWIEPLPRTRRDQAKRARLARLGRLTDAAELAALHTKAQWEAMLVWAGNACVCCSKIFTVKEWATKDHVIPLILGGDDSIANIQPLCPGCNSAKGTMIIDYRKPGWWEAMEWMVRPLAPEGNQP